MWPDYHGAVCRSWISTRPPLIPPEREGRKVLHHWQQRRKSRLPMQFPLTLGGGVLINAQQELKSLLPNHSSLTLFWCRSWSVSLQPSEGGRLSGLCWCGWGWEPKFFLCWPGVQQLLFKRFLFYRQASPFLAFWLEKADFCLGVQRGFLTTPTGICRLPAFSAPSLWYMRPQTRERIHYCDASWVPRALANILSPLYFLVLCLFYV